MSWCVMLIIFKTQVVSRTQDNSVVMEMLYDRLAAAAMEQGA